MTTNNTPLPSVEFSQVVSCGCGIDVHQNLIVATINHGNNQVEIKHFDAYTRSLTELREWCKSEGVTHIAMESTGIYWVPVLNILEEDFEIVLVNARHVKGVPGHKTDKKDSVWLSKLLISGLLKNSFIPPEPIRNLRDLVRYRDKVISQIASEKNRIIKCLESCNYKLSSVFSDVSGVSATKIITDLIDGKSEIDHLMEYIHGKVKADRSDIRKSLEGRMTAHHRFLLRTIQESIAQQELVVAKLSREIDRYAEPYAVEIGLLQTIPGVGRDSTIKLISEIGVDMSKFETDQHLSSWAGMSPGNNESAGKKKVPEPPTETNTSNPC
jgi:transposase